MELFSQKTNWKLAEDLLYSQSCKKDLHKPGRTGEKKHQNGTGIPGRESLKEGRYTWAGPHPREPPCLLGGPLGWLERLEGLEGPGLCS